MSEETRTAAVAGRFYEADGGRLQSQVDGLLANVDAAKTKAFGAVVPHAGLMYSGQCAAIVWAQLEIPDTVVILAPNHTGLSTSIGGASLWRRGSFATPIGDVPIAEAFAAALETGCDLVEHDPLAHQREHAIEVELPFLRTIVPDVAIVPLVLGWDDWSRCRELGQHLAALVQEWDSDVLLVASSDMTHFESASDAEQKDRQVLAAVERLDGRELLEVCRRDRVSMCGRAPAAVVCEAARTLGATAGTVVDYRHSGWVTGDDSEVVAYAGVVLR